MSQIIEHTGRIQHIKDNHIQVLITQNSACSGCHAKSACTAADSAEKIIDVYSDDTSYKVGDNVIVYGQRAVGMKAVLLAFVIPFLLILVSLFVLRAFIENEAISGTLALAVLIPYYIIISLFKDKLSSKFQFHIKRDNI